MMVRTKNPKDRPPNHNMTVGDPQGPDPPGIRKRRLDASAAASSAAASSAAASSAAARGRGSSAAARGRGDSARNVPKKDKIARYNSSSYDSDSDSDSELRSSPSGARSIG